MFDFLKRKDPPEQSPATASQPAPPAPDPETEGVAQPGGNGGSGAPMPGSAGAGTVSPAGPGEATNPTPAPATSAPPAEQPRPAKPKGSGLLYTLFSPQTRAGRALRPLLRWLAAITGLFALGLLAGYILIYQPTQRQLDAALARLSQTNQTASQKDTALQSAQSDRDQAQKALQAAQADLKKLSSENDLLVVLAGASGARAALLNKDGQTAKALLDQAQIDLARALPYLETQDKNRAELLKTRLDLAVKELASDPPATLADLDKLSADLLDLRAKLFKK